MIQTIDNRFRLAAILSLACLLAGCGAPASTATIDGAESNAEASRTLIEYGGTPDPAAIVDIAVPASLSTQTVRVIYCNGEFHAEILPLPVGGPAPVPAGPRADPPTTDPQ